MRALVIPLAGFAAFAAACNCSNVPPGDACSPACGPGATCQNGRCVDSDGGAESSDGGAAFSDGGAASSDGGSAVDGGEQPDAGDPLADGGCVGTASTGKKQPLDMFIMLDQSGSMDENDRWKNVTDALKAFLGQTAMEDVAVGLQYFGLEGACDGPMSCTDDSDCGECGPCRKEDGEWVCRAVFKGDSCDPALYSQAAVEIAPFSEAAPQIIASINQHGPSRGTPTSAALEGAIMHAGHWASGHPQDVAIVVLATDGEPWECSIDLQDINAIAAAGAGGTPKVLTFVIGVGKQLTNLNGIAAAGGTTKAFIVDDSSDVTTQFLDALNRIRGQAISCTYLIPAPPPGKNLDYEMVNVQFSSGGSSPEEYVQVQDEGACASRANAWHYDNPNSPLRIVLCPETCKAVEATATGEVKVVLGCSTNGPN